MSTLSILRHLGIRWGLYLLNWTRLGSASNVTCFSSAHHFFVLSCTKQTCQYYAAQLHCLTLVSAQAVLHNLEAVTAVAAKVHPGLVL